MHDLTALTVADLASISRVILQAGQNARSTEECAKEVVRYLFDNLRTPSGEASCALVRFFKTHSLADLEPDLQAVARQSLPAGSDAPGMKCLTLLATAGLEPEWNSRHQSRGHRVIPLPSVKMVEQFPMISQLIQQLGFRVADIVQPDPDVVLGLQGQNANVFYIADAHGSPHIPAQREFVEPYNVQSVLAFGSVLPSGNLFVVVLFTRVFVPRDRAEMLNVLAIGVKGAVLRFEYGIVFGSPD